MSDPSYRLQPLEYGWPPPEAALLVRRYRLWLHLLLFGLTVLTTLAVGAQLDFNYTHNRPAFDLERDLNPLSLVWERPELLWNGLPFCLTLLGILLVHEMGHFLACRSYGIDASLPYFIPAPTIIGTMGAFIRIRAPIMSRRALFDVGVSGPLVGFAAALPVLIFGIAWSRVAPVIDSAGSVTFGNPLLIQLLAGLFHPGVPSHDLYLHPVARAGWVGLFATALNLLPIGQLDGGHILYALVGEKHRALSRLFLLLLLPLGYFFWLGWVLWAALLFLLGTRHPVLFDPMPLDRRRRWVSLVALAVFILCFMPSPFAAS